MKKPKTPTKASPQISHAEHFRLRLPNEKPIATDADTNGNVLTWEYDGVMFRHHWGLEFPVQVRCWLPGHLPSHLIPKAPTPEELNRQAFEAWAKGTYLATGRCANHPEEYDNDECAAAWFAWQAATTHRPA